MDASKHTKTFLAQCFIYLFHNILHNNLMILFNNVLLTVNHLQTTVTNEFYFM